MPKKNLGSIIKGASQKVAAATQKAAHVVNNAVTTSQIDIKLEALRKDADKLRDSALSLSKQIKENATKAKAIATDVVSAYSKLEKDVAEFQRQKFEVVNPFKVDTLPFLQKKAEIETDAILLTTLDPIVDGDNQAKSPTHLRALISGAAKDSKGSDGKINEEKALAIANENFAKLRKLEADAKDALQVSSNTLTSLVTNMSIWKDMVGTLQRTMSALLKANDELLKSNREKEAAAAAEAKRAADEALAKRRAEIAAERAELARRMAALQAEASVLGVGVQDDQIEGQPSKSESSKLNPPGGAALTANYDKSAAAATAGSMKSTGGAANDPALSTDDATPKASASFVTTAVVKPPAAKPN